MLSFSTPEGVFWARSAKIPLSLVSVTADAKILSRSVRLHVHAFTRNGHIQISRLSIWHAVPVHGHMSSFYRRSFREDGEIDVAFRADFYECAHSRDGNAAFSRLECDVESNFGRFESQRFFRRFYRIIALLKVLLNGKLEIGNQLSAGMLEGPAQKEWGKLPPLIIQIRTG